MERTTTESAASGASLDAYVPATARAASGNRTRWIAHGTLAFFDLSGFTRLSERLASFGRLGAEEVSGAVDRCFADLIDIVLSQGGDLVSFGGDSLTTWFSGDDHPNRAARAAADMQRWIRTGGRSETSAGVVLLKMSAGVATGPVEFVLAGRRSSELLTLGPTVDNVLRVESSTANGQIGVDDSTAAHLAANATRTTRNGSRLLVRHAFPAATSESEHPVWMRSGSLDDRPGSGKSRPPVDAFVLPGLRHIVRDRREHGEHRSATVAFLKVTVDENTPSPSDSFEVIEDVANRYDVNVLATDVEEGGFKVILGAGVPRGVPRRRERVVAATHEACRASPASGGVAHGVVFAGDIGHPDRRVWTVMGDVVNTAARLAASANRGSVSVDRAVVDELGGRFRLGPMRTMRAKGKRHLVQSFAVLDVTSDAVPRDDSLPLLGRTAELDAVRAHTSGPIEIVAPPGHGRTRFLGELSSARPRSIWCEGTPARQRHGWAAVTAVIERIESSEDLDPADRRLLSTVRGRDAGRAPDLLGMSHVVTRLTVMYRRAVGQDATPPPILVDDIQWCDAPSRTLLAALAHDGVPVVATRRPSDPGAFDDAPALVLPPLDDASIETLAVVAATRAMSDHDLAEIVSLSDGVPHHAVALARHRAGQLPDSIENLRTESFDQLSRVALDRLRVAAVAGVHVEPELLAAITGDAAWLEPDTLRTLGAFLMPVSAEPGPAVSAAWRFRHEADRQAAYLAMPIHVRRALHRRLAERLSQIDGDPMAIADHAIHGADDDLCALHAPVAGAIAGARAAWHDAHYYLSHAARASRGAIARGLWRDASVAAEHCGEHGDADRALRAAIGADDETIDVARIWQRRALIARRSGRLSLSLRWSTFGLQTVDRLYQTGFDTSSDADALGDGARAAAALHLERAATLTFQDRLADAEDATRSAEQLVDAFGTDSDRAQILIQREMLAAANGDLAAASAAADAALPILEADGDLLEVATLLLNQGASFGEAGDWAVASDRLRRARVHFRTIGHVAGDVTAESNLCGLLVEQGRIDEATLGFRRIARVGRAADLARLAAFAEASLGRMAAWAGDWPEAERLLVEPIADFPAGGDPALVTWAHLFAAEATALRGDTRSCRAFLDAVTADQLASLPTAAAMHRRLIAWYADDPIEALLGCLDDVRGAGIGFEVMQTARALESLGHTDQRISEEITAWWTSLDIVTPPPVAFPRPAEAA